MADAKPLFGTCSNSWLWVHERIQPPQGLGEPLARRSQSKKGEPSLPLPQQHGENLVGASAHGAGIEAYAGGAVREVNLADGRNAAAILRDNLCVLRLASQLLHLPLAVATSFPFFRNLTWALEPVVSHFTVYSPACRVLPLICASWYSNRFRLGVGRRKGAQGYG